MGDNKMGMTPEEFKERRKKELAILKASNQMLEDAKNNLITMGEGEIDNSKYSDLPAMTKDDKIKAIEAAQEENLAAGQSYYGASEEEIKSSEYSKPDAAAVKQYERRLKLRGLTDEQMRNKKADNVSYVNNTNESDGLIEDYTGKGKTKPPRRVRKTKKEEVAEVEEETINSENKTVEIPKPIPVDLDKERKNNEDSLKEEDESYMFDVSSIPDYVQYDVIPLPSNGQCYKHKKSRIPVAYLTGADENIIASPNMYRDGKLTDILLKRKILDKDINVDELCSGDRDAIVLWLRATAYGNEFPITATNPNTGKQYDTSVDLSKFKYIPFNMKGDENGYFDYEYNNNKIKFKILTKRDEDELRSTILNQISNSEKINLVRNAMSVKESIGRIDISDEDTENLMEDIDEILNVVGETVTDNIDEESYPKTVTEQMVIHTVSINGNSDKTYIRNFIENMRAGDARRYRDYIVNHRPGIDFNIRVNVPKSDGGGSFTTFLRIDDSIFITY